MTFERTGENFFHVFVNGVQVGTVGEKEEAEKLLIKARKNVAAQSEELTFMDVEMSVVGEEVLWGEVDSERQIRAAMEEVLQGSVIETMQKAYTLKVNEYMVNLADMDQVKGLLQAAVDKYDSQGAFRVELCHDTEREFNVLTADVVRREGITKEASVEDICAAGVQTVLGNFGEVTETEENQDTPFEDFELGLLSVNFAE